MRNTIYLRRKNKIILESGENTLSLEYIGALLKNIESLGYTFSSELLDIISTLSLKDMTVFYNKIIKDLKQMVGANVKYKPMYPNFPSQVMNMSETELYFNAMMHYFGDWVGLRILPKSKKEKREELKDEINLKIINLGTEEDFNSIFKNLVSAKTSISETDKEDISWFIRKYKNSVLDMMPNDIPFKENIALITGEFLENNLNVDAFFANNVKTATDILRIAAYLSDGDVSLAKNTKFKKFSRKERRMLLSALENCKDITEDMLRYGERWKRLGERLHPFEYKSNVNTHKSFKVLFNKEKFSTFSSKVEIALQNNNMEEAANLLKNRPGEFARRLDNLVRSVDNSDNIIKAFKEISDKVSSQVLLQVVSHFKHRNEKTDIRTFFPKGNVGKMKVIDNNLLNINDKYCNKIIKICEKSLVKKYKKLDPLGKVYIDERLRNYNIPFAMRSASKSLKTVARGSKYDLPDADTVRFFLWWKDGDSRTDLDLSIIGLDEDHNWKVQISYTNLKQMGACHSGDITSAPNGASEFIDVPIQKFIEQGIRYVMMSVFSFTSQPYHDLPDCFAGVMGRQKPKSGEIYDPKTVDNKLDLTADTTICIPMIADIVDKKVIWTDLALKANPIHSNNLHSNMSSLTILAKAMTSLKKPNLYDLFKLHVSARGELTDNIEEAETVFSEKDGITPYDTDIIISEFI